MIRISAIFYMQVWQLPSIIEVTCNITVHFSFPHNWKAWLSDEKYLIWSGRHWKTDNPRKTAKSKADYQRIHRQGLPSIIDLWFWGLWALFCFFCYVVSCWGIDLGFLSFFWFSIDHWYTVLVLLLMFNKYIYSYHSKNKTKNKKIKIVQYHIERRKKRNCLTQ